MRETISTIDFAKLTDAAFIVTDSTRMRPLNAAARRVEANGAVFPALSKLVAKMLDRNVDSAVESEPGTGTYWTVSVVAVNGEKVVMVRELPLPVDWPSMRSIVHELRNISFGLLMTAEDIAEECPTADGVRHLRGFVARIAEMADIVRQLSEPAAATVERVTIDAVLEALAERFPATTFVRIGVRELVAIGDAQLLLRALAVMVAVLADKVSEVTVATSRDDDGIHVEIGTARQVHLHPSLAAELARRLVTVQGGELDVLRDGRLAFLTTLPEAHEGAL